MFSRMLLVAIIAALAMVLIVPMVASAGPRGDHRRDRFHTGCDDGRYLSLEQKADAKEVVAAVLSEYQVNAPEDASGALTSSIENFYGAGLGCVLSDYVHRRVPNAADNWFDNVVSLNTQMTLAGVLGLLIVAGALALALLLGLCRMAGRNNADA